VERAVSEPPRYLGQDMLKTIVDAQDRMPSRTRIAGRYTHLTSLIHGCARAQVIAREQRLTPSESVTGGHRVMWRIGRATEAHFRDSYIRAVDYKGVIGRWSCVCGRTSYQGLFNTRATRCRHCEYQPTVYKELTVKDEEAGIAGNPDFLLRLGGPVVVVELKSMNAENWNKLEEAMPDHVVQAGGYRRLLMQDGVPVLAYVIVVYVKKDFKWGSPYKEFHVRVDGMAETPSYVVPTLDIMWQRARAIKNGTLQDLPPRECQRMDETRAINCYGQASCWSMDE
jgi:hypothetical protein